MTPNRQRLDLALVARGLVTTRARARDAIVRGCVKVDGGTVTAVSQQVAPDAAIVVDDPAGRYVSRAALKLIAGLDQFGYRAEGMTVLDIGASTGGFTQVLIERGAERVYAVDVGHGQLHPRLRKDPRIVGLEGVNARDLGPEHIGDPIDAVVSDVSFISLRLALPPALALASPGAWGVFLVKPQFEVGRERVGKGGIVRDAEVAKAAAQAIADWLAVDMGWTIDGLVESPLAGGDGNREFLLGARK
ncbi:MAG TPA: TlyA family RNA methyltransferase [Bauldia sp.]|nr:TlyA family RNA methyltransferase [Bauldia sp.]